MIWLFLLCTVLFAIIVILSIKIRLMRKAMKEISREFSEKLNTDTNTLISISSNDKVVNYFANDINIQIRKLRKQRHRFVQGDTELKNAITNISHDLRTPLTAICSYLDLLDETEKSSRAAQYIEVIKNRTELMKQLTEELFRYSVILSTNQDMVLENVVVNRVLEESIAEFYAALKEKNISPNIKMTEKKIVRCLNKPALSRVFSNIINNALKYSDGDLDIELMDTGEIIFSNTAVKLDEVQVGKLFNRFFTVDVSRKSTGLGLSIAQTLMEQMEGTITAEYVNKKLYIRILFSNHAVKENCK